MNLSSSMIIDSDHVIDRLTEQDREMKALLKKWPNLEDILKLKGGEKIYYVENSKVITQVYKAKMREELITALTELGQIVS